MNNLTQHSILLTLANGPRYGYDILSQIISDSGGSVIIPLTSLYRFINKLDRDGYIQKNNSAEQNYKNLYQITRKGEAELYRAAIIYGDFATKARQRLR